MCSLQKLPFKMLFKISKSKREMATPRTIDIDKRQTNHMIIFHMTDGYSSSPIFRLFMTIFGLKTYRVI